MKDWERRLEDVVTECANWAEMAYLGNADERSALRSIRARLEPFAKAIDEKRRAESRGT